jgi:hypothetical protein
MEHHGARVAFAAFTTVATGRSVASARNVRALLYKTHAQWLSVQPPPTV